MENRSQTTEIIKKTAHDYLPDAEVLLFGSRARYPYPENSDYDILLITASLLNPGKKLSLRTGIRKTLLQKGIRTDVLIQSRMEVDTKKELPGHILRTILREAIIL